jgi:hypothetical protein
MCGELSERRSSGAHTDTPTPPELSSNSWCIFDIANAGHVDEGVESRRLGRHTVELSAYVFHDGRE